MPSLKFLASRTGILRKQDRPAFLLAVVIFVTKFSKIKTEGVAASEF